MKKATSGDRGSAAKGNAAPKSVDEYLAGVPEPARSTLNRVRAAIRSALPPQATEAISYRIPTFKYKGSLLGFAAFSDHCSLFPMSGSVIEAFKNELKDFQTSKGTIRFPMDKPLPAALVKKLVKARIAEKERKKERRSGRSRCPEHVLQGCLSVLGKQHPVAAVDSDSLGQSRPSGKSRRLRFGVDL